MNACSPALVALWYYGGMIGALVVALCVFGISRQLRPKPPWEQGS